MPSTATRRLVVTNLSPLVLCALSVGAWWWTIRVAAAGDMAVGPPLAALVTFLVGWTVMMAAMMLPAVSPAVRIYARAAAGGGVAATPVFVLGYLVVWAASGLPGYVAWRAVPMPMAGHTRPAWVAVVGGLVLIGAGVWQFTPLKDACLRHCRSPLSLFVEHGAAARRAHGAFALGARHGLWCLGCCWALMAVLIPMGMMNLAWMAAISVVIFLEKVVPHGPLIARIVGVAVAVTGLLILVEPSAMGVLT